MAEALALGVGYVNSELRELSDGRLFDLVDYFARYRPLPTASLVEQTLAIVAQTGLTGLHFGDEAMPAAVGVVG